MPEKQGLRLSQAFIGLGSNLEPRLSHLQTAVNQLRILGEVIRISQVYETAPVGKVEQPDFLNAAVELRTALSPLDLFHGLKEIEKTIGRQARPKWHEREIDLDLLFFDDLVLKSPELIVPHPEIPHRAFVLVPLADLNVKFVHPIFRRTITDLLTDIETAGVERTDLLLA
jgi:2-amino-4-hydroxy-6-hydroxymethyldihydropteridine diphosphokinase